jgi:hypothetical protein
MVEIEDALPRHPFLGPSRTSVGRSRIVVVARTTKSPLKPR